MTSSHILKTFSLSGSRTILVFPYQTLWQYFDGTPKLRQQSRFSTNIWLWHRWLLDRRVSSIFRPWRFYDTYGNQWRLFIARDGRRSATHQWILFMTESLDATLKITEQTLTVRIGRSEAKVDCARGIALSLTTRSIALPLCDSRASFSVVVSTWSVFTCPSVMRSSADQ